ncbi:MAG: hypothetical protein K6D02_07350, partial [Lachnospiraceae bacterium]|nr:hypothetical protein [Lachnospiraceae bacterium]
AGEYKTNYKKAVKAKAKGKTDGMMALKTHDILNHFIEDNSGKKMGDYLLNDFSLEKKEAELRNVIIRSNAQIIASIENYMIMASGNAGETWIEKLVRVNKTNSLYERTVIQFKTKKLAKKRLEEKYGETIDLIISGWDSMQDRINDTEEVADKIEEMVSESDKYKDSEDPYTDALNDYFGINEEEATEIEEDMTDKEKTEAISDNVDLNKANEKLQDYINTSVVIAYLKSIDFEEGSLYDFFVEERDFDEADERMAVAQIADVISDAQTEVIGEKVDIFNLIKYAMGDASEGKAEESKEIEKSLKKYEDISIYKGVNQKIFDGEVAITSLADTRTANFVDIPEDLTAVYFICGLGVFSGAVVTLGAVLFLKDIIARWFFDGGSSRMVRNICKRTLNLVGKLYGVEYKTLSIEITFGSGSRLNPRYDNFVLQQKIRNLSYGILLGVGIVIALIGIAYSAYSIWNIIQENKKKLIGDYSVAIPEFMIDVMQDETDETYVYYEAVRCNRNDPNMTGAREDNEGLKDFGDINGDTGKYWVAMYTTTDYAAGKPILAGSIEVLNGEVETDEEYKKVSMFNNRYTGANFTSEEFCFSDSKKGTTVRYKVESSKGTKSSNSASIFTAGNKAVGIIIGILIGGIISSLTAVMIRKRRKTLVTKD